VADGFAATARVITAAAAIMIVVFGGFVLEDNRIIKMFGLGLAVGGVPRCDVRPHAARAGDDGTARRERNWWLPKWLDRILPRPQA
jgi:putative drug exporter of the RND superfamily